MLKRCHSRVPVLVEELPGAVLNPVHELALENSSAGERDFSLAFLFVESKWAAVDRSIGGVIDSFSMHHILDPDSFVGASIRPSVGAVALHGIFEELAFIHFPVRPSHHALVFESIHEFAFEP